MKAITSLLLLIFFQFGFAQSILGKWKTIDDETGKEKAIIELYEKNGKVYGKIIEILQPENKLRKCNLCEGEEKNKPILGMIVIKDLTKSGHDYDNGKIIDPKNGKTYRCKISLSEKNMLMVRGYIGLSLFGRTQTWVRP